MAPSFVCTYEFDALGSNRIGRGLYSGSYDEITVRDGEIVDVFGHVEIAKFRPEMWKPFAEWVSYFYPEDVAVMFKSGQSDYQLSPESIRLWEQRTREYVEAVLQEDECQEDCVAENRRDYVEAV